MDDERSEGHGETHGGEPWEEEHWGGHGHGHGHRHHGPGRGGRAGAGFGGMPGLGTEPGFAGDDEPGMAMPPFFLFGGPGRPGWREFPGGPQGPGPWPRGPRGHGRGSGRARRGDVRAAALALLAEEPMNGYQIIQQIAARSGGLWRASPGSVYPALAQLEDEGLIALQATGKGRRGYELTGQGRAYVAAHAEELRTPWSAVTGGAASVAADMHALVGQVHLAALQVVSAGTDPQIGQARTVLAQARRALYRILAEDDQGADDPAPDGSAGDGPAPDDRRRGPGRD